MTTFCDSIRSSMPSGEPPRHSRPTFCRMNEKPTAVISGASFGVNLDIPLFTGESLELRVGGGATVFRAQNSARIHGYHAGVRIDFSI